MALFSKLKSSKNNDRDITLLKRDEYKSIIVLIDNPENIVHNLLHKSFINADFSYLTNRSEKLDISTGNNYTFHKKDLTFAKVKNERLSNLLTLKFDLLIDLSQQNDSLKYFTERLNAGLKIGCFDTTKNFFYDLLVEKKETIGEILKQMEQQIDLLTIKR